MKGAIPKAGHWMGTHQGLRYFGIYLPVLMEYEVENSNGKSLIVEERLYSFFFVFFPKKNEALFFRFSSSTQLLKKTFVLL
jgi:hypothetical protein